MQTPEGEPIEWLLGQPRIELARKIAKFVNSDPQEIIFTKNATESINIVVRG